jgi:hypothetical protein
VAKNRSQSWSSPVPRAARGAAASATGWLSFFALGGLPSLVPLSAVFADGDGQHVVTVGAQSPVLRIVGEDDAMGARL